jgi:hypothetical protein
MKNGIKFTLKTPDQNILYSGVCFMLPNRAPGAKQAMQPARHAPLSLTGDEVRADSRDIALSVCVLGRLQIVCAYCL